MSTNDLPVKKEDKPGGTQFKFEVGQMVWFSWLGCPCYKRIRDKTKAGDGMNMYWVMTPANYYDWCSEGDCFETREEFLKAQTEYLEKSTAQLLEEHIKKSS